MRRYDELNNMYYTNRVLKEDKYLKNDDSYMSLYDYKKDLDRKIIEEENTIYEVDCKCIDSYRNNR